MGPFSEPETADNSLLSPRSRKKKGDRSRSPLQEGTPSRSAETSSTEQTPVEEEASEPLATTATTSRTISPRRQGAGSDGPPISPGRQERLSINRQQSSPDLPIKSREGASSSPLTNTSSTPALADGVVRKGSTRRLSVDPFSSGVDYLIQDLASQAECEFFLRQIGQARIYTKIYLSKVSSKSHDPSFWNVSPLDPQRIFDKALTCYQKCQSFLRVFVIEGSATTFGAALAMRRKLDMYLNLEIVQALHEMGVYVETLVPLVMFLDQCSSNERIRVEGLMQAAVQNMIFPPPPRAPEQRRTTWTSFAFDLPTVRALLSIKSDPSFEQAVLDALSGFVQKNLSDEARMKVLRVVSSEIGAWALTRLESLPTGHFLNSSYINILNMLGIALPTPPSLSSSSSSESPITRQRSFTDAVEPPGLRSSMTKTLAPGGDPFNSGSDSEKRSLFIKNLRRRKKPSPSILGPSFAIAPLALADLQSSASFSTTSRPVLPSGSMTDRPRRCDTVVTESVSSTTSDDQLSIRPAINAEIPLIELSLPGSFLIEEIMQSRRWHAEAVGAKKNKLTLTAEDELWFGNQLFNKEHANYFSDDKLLGPMVISVENNSQASESTTDTTAMGIVFTIHGKGVYRLQGKPSRRKLLKAAGLESVKTTRIKDKTFSVRLRDFEKQTRQERSFYKFGVLYCRDTQDENAMYSNRHEDTSPQYRAFLSWLGTEVKLNGFQGYRGGLDVRGDSTGTHSIHRQFDAKEIMFHVSTMLPFSAHDPQQLERKRHLGNDIVLIIFKDGSAPLDPARITSQFNSIFVVVSSAVHEGQTWYRVQIARKALVESCKPRFTTELFHQGPVFADWFFTKLINSERSAIDSPVFAKKMERTRQLTLQGLIAPYREP